MEDVHGAWGMDHRDFFSVAGARNGLENFIVKKGLMEKAKDDKFTVYIDK